MPSHKTVTYRTGQAGFTYLGLMIAVAVLGVVLAGAGVVWRTSQQREREKELLYIGNEIESAIAGYFDELAQTREMLDSRYDGIRSGKVKLIPGDVAYASLMESIESRRSKA